MKFKEYIKETVRTFAFWISPKGEITGSMKSHISQVIQAPEKFGLTREYIKDKYDRYGEKLGLEGKAREEIMKEIFDAGFTRIRKYGNSGWTVDTGKADKRFKQRITKWAEKITEKGIDGIQETNMKTMVNISDMRGYNKQMPIDRLATGALLFESENNIDLTYCQSINDFSDHPLII